MWSDDDISGSLILQNQIKLFLWIICHWVITKSLYWKVCAYIFRISGTLKYFFYSDISININFSPENISAIFLFLVKPLTHTKIYPFFFSSMGENIVFLAYSYYFMQLRSTLCKNNFRFNPITLFDSLIIELKLNPHLVFRMAGKQEICGGLHHIYLI